MKDGKIRVGIYLRVSSEGQVNDEEGKRIEDGSLEVQKQRAIAHVKSQCQQLGKEYEIKYIIEDAGKSAKDMNRPGFQKLMQIIDQKLIDWIVASELSRFNRDAYDYLFFKNHCKNNNVQIVYVGNAIRERDDLTDLMETMLAASAEFERKMTALRVKRNIISRLKTDGKINGTTTILGLDKCPKRKGHYVINQSERESLIQLLNVYLECSSIQDTLVRAKSLGIYDKGNKPFTFARLKSVLFNVEWRYSGYWYLEEQDNEKLIIGLDHGPLIGDELKKKSLIRETYML